MIAKTVPMSATPLIARNPEAWDVGLRPLFSRFGLTAGVVSAVALTDYRGAGQ